MKLQTLKKRGSKLATPNIQIAILEETTPQVTKFEHKLQDINLMPFKPTKLEIFQINVGYMCNMTCEHCHVDAGPTRTEIMTKATMQHCLDAIKKAKTTTVDITGGAPEMNPDFQWFIEQIRAISKDIEIIIRSNLTILVSNKEYRTYPEFFKKHNLTVIASLPCYTAANTDKQRGDKAFVRSIEALQLLNELGYGKEGTGLNLHLVFNPGGASLPGNQAGLEADYKRVLKKDFNLEFNNLYTITNLPISRFLDYLLKEEKFDDYMQLLLESFNPAAAESVMCRNTLSVSWDGYLYDCDFNQMLQLQVEKSAPQHIENFDLKTLEERNIMLGQHCYGCTAGAGSSCQGTVA
ncbi:arsenosugar biosynthesis radical SAM (seleno)protein ArsS [Aureispira anguillae]|uniref:Arsenosugar biosynthesis radical SAM protein ArsS n=1 Tax=Aureispira anguillae TaxID=2864201 RepID=A0A915YFE2_9BACT|nr:arsenosugar biosynthesis radical SAM (seleno)protein ArsS [Aureispira anguillae]BDS11988.1 arsenosugar biosynthesis radical SAM protein ArsS [Aureispira anguillae]